MRNYSIESLEKEFSENFNSPLFSVLAEEYFRIKEYNKCKKVLEIGLLLNPDNNDGKFILSKIKLLENNIEKAQNILNSIIKSDPLYLNAIKLQIEISETINKGTKSLYTKLSSVVKSDESKQSSLEVKKKKVLIPKNKHTKKKKTVFKISSPKSSKTQSKPTKISIKRKVKSVNVTSKMKTLTMVNILMNQGHYNQSSSMLKALLSKGTISKQKFSEIKAEIENLKSKQKK